MLECIRRRSTRQKLHVWIDLDWERERQGDDLDVNHDPFELALAAFRTIGKPTGLYDVMRDLFRNTVLGLHSLRDRLTIEAIPGDVTIVLEQIRYGLVGHRSQADPTVETDAINLDKLDITERNEYPHIYDRIHLSNIPDYIGGTTPIVLYALPIVFREPDSLVTCNCLRNTPRFRSHAYYNNEYTAGLSRPVDLERTFKPALASMILTTSLIILNGTIAKLSTGLWGSSCHERNSKRGCIDSFSRQRFPVLGTLVNLHSYTAH